MDESNLNLDKFFTINQAEKFNVIRSLKAPLSGYLGGINKAGYFVTKLQDKWREAFGVKHAVACNSATSGLLAACMAIGIGPGDLVWTTAYSMSATAACAKVLGAHIVFIDIETTRFSLDLGTAPTGPMPKCIIVTNLFGHPAMLTHIRSWCESNNVWMIEDNAQSPFATEGEEYAGTVGHVGVFSLNVHKHIQCGEGGVIVTDDDGLAVRLAGCINHGELGAVVGCGLNLRMAEPVAAIACAQLAKAPAIIKNRIEQAEELTDMVKDIPWIKPHTPDTGCTHVYYIWSALVDDPEQKRRFHFCTRLQQEGVPMLAGYTKPLHGVFGVHANLPVVQRVQYKQIIIFENCMWAPGKRAMQKMRQLINEVAGRIE